MEAVLLYQVFLFFFSLCFFKLLGCTDDVGLLGFFPWVYNEENVQTDSEIKNCQSEKYALGRFLCLALARQLGMRQSGVRYWVDGLIPILTH